MPENWSIVYSERNLDGVAVHGVLTILDGNGNVVQSFEGLATDSNGKVLTIGSSINGDVLQGYYYNEPSPNAISPPVTVYSGSENQVKARALA